MGVRLTSSPGDAIAVLHVSDASQRALRCILEYLYTLVAPIDVLATDELVRTSAHSLCFRI